MKNNSCFSIKNLSFSYGEKRIFQNLSLEIPYGKVTTIMGANGCGKSTLFQLLTKNEVPSSGVISLQNHNLSGIDLKSFSKKVATVHQTNTAPNDMTVKKLVSYGRVPYTRLGLPINTELDERMINRAMKITGILRLKDRTIQQLSGGQRQRAWIAMALAQGTKIILLDEPTTYLDIRYQIQILRMIKALNQKAGITVVMVLHDINQALSYSDEIIALSPHGEPVVQGQPQEIISEEVIKKIYGIDLAVKRVNDKPFVITV